MSKFQQRHYEEVAEILSSTRDLAKGNEGWQSAVEFITNRFIAMFQRDNPNFKVGKFRKAAGQEE